MPSPFTRSQKFQTKPTQLHRLLPHWMMHFKHGCILDGSHHKSGQKTSSLTLAVTDEVGLLIQNNGQDPFQQLKAYHQQQPSWLFGFLSYDLKNDIEKLHSQKPDKVGMPLLHFFRPQVLLQITREEVEISTTTKHSPTQIWDSIQSTHIPAPQDCCQEWQINTRETEQQYKDTIAQIREHIIAGDIYEMNYCTEFFMESCMVCPAHLYHHLSHVAKAPFSAFYKCDDRYLICGSPERFMQKQGQRLSSQPIKGTAPRGNTPTQDEQNRNALSQSSKDKAENVMIVDLVRNDLARVCQPGSVQVDELFGIHPFEQVWHMVSTISGKLKENYHWTDAIRTAFPMGSMTGTPKVMAMQLIEQYEKTRRGLYSGSVGWVNPQGDFDFNVVIRSILFNEANHYLSYHVGGAIVYDSEPSGEYAECLLKAQGMRKALDALHKTMLKD